MPKLYHFFITILMLTVFVKIFTPTAYASDFQQKAASLARIDDLRVSSANGKLRLVADATKEVDYESFGLTAPNRIVIDLKGSWLNPKLKTKYTIDDINVHIAQFTPNTVRIVVNTAAQRNAYDVFALSGGKIPYRVVMDFNKAASTSTTPQANEKSAVSSNVSAVNSNTSPTTATPTVESNNFDMSIFKTPGIKGKTIAIDPGHGGNDSGAIGPSKGMEKNTTLQIGLDLKKLLEKAGAKVIMTRTTDTSVAAPTATDIEELQARCDIANKNKADIFLSIHNDSFTDSYATGTSSYYYEKGSGVSKRLANCLRQGVIEEIHTPDRGTRSCNFYVVKHTVMPATLIEVAFISNPNEEKLLMSDDGDEKIAEGIFMGIQKFFAAAASDEDDK